METKKRERVKNMKINLFQAHENRIKEHIVYFKVFSIVALVLTTFKVLSSEWDLLTSYCLWGAIIS